MTWNLKNVSSKALTQYLYIDPCSIIDVSENGVTNTEVSRQMPAVFLMNFISTAVTLCVNETEPDVSWIRLVRDSGEWRAFMNTVMKLQVSWKTVHVLTSWVTARLSVSNHNGWFDALEHGRYSTLPEHRRFRNTSYSICDSNTHRLKTLQNPSAKIPPRVHH
jgi:hypothetical protein